MTRSLNLVFCGTPAFSVPTLERLADAGYKILLAVTQFDKPSGRGLERAPSPVKLPSARKSGVTGTLKVCASGGVRRSTPLISAPITGVTGATLILAYG